MIDKKKCRNIARFQSKANYWIMMIFLSVIFSLFGCRQDNQTGVFETTVIQKMTIAQLNEDHQKQSMLLIDIRDQAAINAQPIKNATVIPQASLKKTLHDAPRNHRYVIIGNNNHPGLLAAQQMQKMGFERLNYIDGDDAAWRTGGSTAN